MKRLAPLKFPIIRLHAEQQLTRLFEWNDGVQFSASPTSMNNEANPGEPGSGRPR